MLTVFAVLLATYVANAANLESQVDDLHKVYADGQLVIDGKYYGNAYSANIPEDTQVVAAYLENIVSKTYISKHLVPCI